jgi:hypothetical protein
MKASSKAKAELALMGVVITPENNDEAVEIIDYIMTVLKNKSITGQEILTNAFQYSHDPKSKQTAHGLSVNTIGFHFKCITVIEENPKNLETDNGVLCWVENLTAPECSELSYCFFERHSTRGSLYRRVG